MSKVKFEALYLPTKDHKIDKSYFLITFWHTWNVHFQSTQKISMDQNILLFCIFSILSIIISSKNRSLMVNLDCSSITKHYIISSVLYSLYINSYIQWSWPLSSKTDLDNKRQSWFFLLFDLAMTGIENWIWPLGQNQAMVIMRKDIISKYGKRDGGCLAC